MYNLVLGKCEVTDSIPEGQLFLMCTELPLCNSGAQPLLLDFPAYTRTSSVSKKLDPAAEFKGLENTDWEMYKTA